MGVSTYVSTYQHDFSRNESRGRSRSFSAMQMHKPSTGIIPTAGRPSTKSGPEVILLSDKSHEDFVTIFV